MSSKLEALQRWVDEVAALTRPAQIHWCDGSDAEYHNLVQQMLQTGDLIELNQQTHPGCYLHRSSPSDVARVEHLTFVCTKDEEDAGPNNHWMAPADAHAKMDALFEGCMEGRTMYVIPYCMGPIDSPLARCGVEITDSPYVVANMRIMTRMGAAAQARIEREGSFVKGLHSTGELDPERRFIMHFPEELTIKSYGSGYGGNALLGKKCHALRIASYQARVGRLAGRAHADRRHREPQGRNPLRRGRLPVRLRQDQPGHADSARGLPQRRLESVDGRRRHLLDASRRRRPSVRDQPGSRLLRRGTGHQRVDQPERAGDRIARDTIFTNVAVTADNQPWWEGLPGTPVTDWQGRPYDAANGPAAHPNSRFTVSARQCPTWSPHAEDAQGVPISAIVFGGRRPSLVPLVFEARDWTHGVLVGAAMGSETTAAATGAVGVLRRDSMAMKPFCRLSLRRLLPSLAVV